MSTQSTQTPVQPATSPSVSNANWPLASLRPNPLNPRGPVDPATVEELAASIRAQGVLQPLLVTPDGVIVAGHRRHAAAQLAGLAGVPVVVRAMAEADQLSAMLTENIQRQALTPLAEARSYRRLVGEWQLSVAEVTRRVGVSVGLIRKRLDLFRLAPGVQALYDTADAPPATLVDVLLTVADPARQLELARLATDRGMTVDQIRGLLARGSSLNTGGGGGGGTRGAAATGRDARAAVFNALLKRANEQVSLGALAIAMEAVCCACNAHRTNPGECPACPLCATVGMVLNPRLLRQAEQQAGQGVRRVA